MKILPCGDLVIAILLPTNILYFWRNTKIVIKYLVFTFFIYPRLARNIKLIANIINILYDVYYKLLFCSLQPNPLNFFIQNKNRNDGNQKAWQWWQHLKLCVNVLFPHLVIEKGTILLPTEGCYLVPAGSSERYVNLKRSNAPV
jgi:hypothetical protein